MGALANFIERAGVATASISLIREQSEAVKPPRALWVPFALGRPLGSAEDPEFQKAVLGATLGMLATAQEPTIEDYAVEAPSEAQPGEWVCPVNFAVSEDPSFEARLVDEVTRLAPWSRETRRDRGRTLFGASGASPEQIEEVARALGAIADKGTLEAPTDSTVAWQFEMPLLTRHLADDLRTFYHEAIAAQPGPDAPNHEALSAWIFSGTALGDTLIAIADHLTRDGELTSLMTRGFLIPEGFYHGGSAFPTASEPEKDL